MLDFISRNFGATKAFYAALSLTIAFTCIGVGVIGSALGAFVGFVLATIFAAFGQDFYVGLVTGFAMTGGWAFFLFAGIVVFEKFDSLRKDFAVAILNAHAEKQAEISRKAAVWTHEYPAPNRDDQCREYREYRDNTARSKAEAENDRHAALS